MTKEEFNKLRPLAFAIVDPDKLAHLGPVADVSSVLGSAR
jgi:hypothetical protein